jgi:hypothetical protein
VFDICSTCVLLLQLAVSGWQMMFKAKLSVCLIEYGAVKLYRETEV